MSGNLSREKTKKFKIGILADEIAPGSAPKLIGWPIRKLAERGIEAEALVIINKDHWQKHRAHFDSHLSGVKVRYFFSEYPAWARKLNFKFPGMSFFSLHHIMSRFFAHRGIKPGEFDIIIANCQYSTFAARNIKKRLGIPFIFLIWDPSTFTAEKIYKHRFGWKYPLLYQAAKLLDRYAIKECEAIITSGKFHHRHLRGLTDKPLEILAPGCFAMEKLPDFSAREDIILTYDRWDIGNVPTIFLDLLDTLKDKKITLTIGGFWYPVSLRQKFLDEVVRRNLQERVTLLGPLNEDKIMELCSRAMVHIHPVHEAFGMQTLEAAACGCPIIIPAGSGVADLFQHGVHGYFPEPGNIAKLVGYTEAIFNDRNKAADMGKKAWEVAKQYSWESYAGKLLKIAGKYV